VQAFDGTRVATRRGSARVRKYRRSTSTRHGAGSAVPATGPLQETNRAAEVALRRHCARR
jgi:hypothetical protein